MSAESLPVPDLATRRAPGLGGLNTTVLRLETRRLTRNRRTIVFSVASPVAFFLLFGLGKSSASEVAGHGNFAASMMTSVALYGAALATTSGGAMVSIDRAAGWSRQLRLTPISPAAYITIKMTTAMLFGLVSVATVFATGIITGKASMPGYLWVATGICVWTGSLVFAAFGLFIGYLLPTENVMQILGVAMTLLAFGGGLFIPLNQYPHPLQGAVQFTPLYGLNQLVHAPALASSIQVAWVANAAGWLAIFIAGAIWRFRKDTARA